MATFLVTRQNGDGTYDTVGGSNRYICSDYKNLQVAWRYSIKQFAQGRTVQIEQYANIFDEKPTRTFYMCDEV